MDAAWGGGVRLACLAVVILYGAGGYLVLNRWPFSARTPVPLVPGVDEVPVWPWTVVLYVSLYPFIGLVILLLPHRGAARRYLVGLIQALTLAYAIFALWPTRIDRAPAPGGALLGPALDWLRAIDAPHNCLPSLHVTHCVLGISALWRTHWRGPFLLWAVAICGSTLTTDQHAFLDLPAGLLLGWGAVVASRPRR